MTKRRRILYVDLAPSVGGSILSLYELLRRLDRRRYDPHVLLYGGNGYVDRFRDLGVPVLTLAGANAASPDPASQAWSGARHSRLASWLKSSALGEELVHLAGFYLRIWPGLTGQARQVASIIRSLRPDLVHLNDAVCVSRVGILGARWAHTPAICHLRAMDWRNHYDRWLSRSLRGYICISHAVDKHQRQLGGRVEPSWVVYNGLDLAAFDKAAAGSDIRQELGLLPGDCVIGCIGRLVRWKGQHIFLRALASLVPDYPNLRGLIVGGPEPNTRDYEDELRALARTLGLEPRVTFTGFRNDIPRILRGLDILVHASIAPEPFGRVLIEGMAAGVPTVGTAAGAVSEIVEDNITGLLVFPDDPQAMTGAMARILGDPEGSAAMRSAARRAVEARFSIAHYVRGVERVYEELLD